MFNVEFNRLNALRGLAAYENRRKWLPENLQQKELVKEVTDAINIATSKGRASTLGLPERVQFYNKLSELIEKDFDYQKSNKTDGDLVILMRDFQQTLIPREQLPSIIQANALTKTRSG